MHQTFRYEDDTVVGQNMLLIVQQKLNLPVQFIWVIQTRAEHSQDFIIIVFVWFSDTSAAP